MYPVEPRRFHGSWKSLENHLKNKLPLSWTEANPGVLGKLNFKFNQKRRLFLSLFIFFNHLISSNFLFSLAGSVLAMSF